MNVYIVVAAYNEENNISRAIDDLESYGYHNVVIVDDKSQDRTVEIVKNKNVNLLQHVINRGQGASLQTGHDFALQNGADIVVDFDGDGQMQAKDIEKLIQPILENQADIVFGSRFLDKKTKIPLIKKYLIHKPARQLNNFLTGISLSDVHCGFRALGKIALERIQLTQDRMSHSTEFVSLTKRLNLKYNEVPVEIIYNEFGQSFGGGLKILKELFINKILR